MNQITLVSSIVVITVGFGLLSMVYVATDGEKVTPSIYFLWKIPIRDLQ